MATWKVIEPGSPTTFPIHTQKLLQYKAKETLRETEVPLTGPKLLKKTVRGWDRGYTREVRITSGKYVYSLQALDEGKPW